MASSSPIPAVDLADEVAKAGAEVQPAVVVRQGRGSQAEGQPAVSAGNGGGTTFSCEKKNKAPKEKHITSITDETIILKRSIPFHRDTVNMRTADVSLVRVSTADVSVGQLIRTAWKPTLFAIVILIIGDKQNPKNAKMIGLGSVLLILCIAYVVLKHLGAVVEFEGDVSAFGYTLLPKEFAAVANNWAVIPPKERVNIVDAFIAAKTAGKANTGAADVVIKATSHIAGRIITNTCDITVGQHYVRIVNKGGYLTPCGRPYRTEEMAFATDDIRYINCSAGEKGGPLKVAFVVAVLVFFFDLGKGDDETNAVVAVIFAALVYVVLSMRSGAPVQFGLKGGAYATGMINSMAGRRALTELVNARQLQRELPAQQPAVALQKWKGQQPGQKADDKKEAGYDMLELHTDCVEINSFKVGCKILCAKCCVGETDSWNVLLKHAHSIQTSYQGFAQFLWASIFFFVVFIIIMFVVDPPPEDIKIKLAPLVLSIIFALVFHFTKTCYFFFGTNEVDSNMKQVPLALMFKGTEAKLEAMVTAIRNQQALNSNGDASGGGGGQIVGLVPAAGEA